MATRLTRNLRLRIEDGLSAASIANLERLDSLGASVYISTGDDVVIRAREDIILQPSSDDIGGDGTGGTIYLASSGSPADSVEVHTTQFLVSADQFILNGEVMPAASEILTEADLSGYEENLGLPSGNAYVLRSDTDGNRYWTSLSGVVASQNEAVDWTPADGSTKVINHGYSAEFVEVQVYDPATAKYIGLENITYLDSDTVELEILGVPANTWKVFIREIIS